MPSELSDGAWWPRLLLLLLGLGPDTPGLGSGCLCALGSDLSSEPSFNLDWEQGTHFSLGAAGLRELRDGALQDQAEGEGWGERAPPLLPADTCRVRALLGGEQHQAWTLVIFMDQTLGGALDSLLGCSLPELSGHTLETIYSPKVLGTSGGVAAVALKAARACNPGKYFRLAA